MESQLGGSTVWLLKEAGSFDYTIDFKRICLWRANYRRRVGWREGRVSSSKGRCAAAGTACGAKSTSICAYDTVSSAAAGASSGRPTAPAVACTCPSEVRR